jgi:hypothetical protein
MRIAQTKEQIRALKAFQDHCEIDTITLQSCVASRAKAGTKFIEPFAVKPNLSNIAGSLQEEQFVVEVSFEYTAWDSSEPSERLFKIDCTFEVCYRIRDAYNPTEEERSSFSKGTAVFNCWPYAREFLRDVTARLGHQTPALPLLRITPKKPEITVPTVRKVASNPPSTPPSPESAPVVPSPHVD